MVSPQINKEYLQWMCSISVDRHMHICPLHCLLQFISAGIRIHVCCDFSSHVACRFLTNLRFLLVPNQLAFVHSCQRAQPACLLRLIDRLLSTVAIRSCCTTMSIGKKLITCVLLIQLLFLTGLSLSLWNDYFFSLVLSIFSY